VLDDQFVNFDWDDGNQDHILRHRVTPKEVEEAVGNKNVVFAAKTVEREKRWKLFGKTYSGRYIVVVFAVAKACSGPSPLTT
jgi:uncharacterized DUF497 family protein